MSKMLVCPVCGQVRGTNDRLFYVIFAKIKTLLS